MQEIILHAGFHKTGSSSIQASLAAVDLGDTAYLNWGHINHSMPFLAGFTCGELAVTPAGFTGATTGEGKKAVADLGAALDASKAKRVIISAESFSGTAYRPGLELFRDFLRAYCDCIRVIAYLRPIESLIASDFQQCVRAGLPVELGRPVDYLARCQMLDAVFGRENVAFHVFSRETLIGGDVVHDFAARIGIDLSPGKFKRANESVPLETVAVARVGAIFGEVGVGDEIDLELNHYASNQLRQLGATKFKIRGDVIARLTEPFRGEVEAVQRRLGGMFPVFSADSSGGISSDDDLIEIAIGLEDKVFEIVERLGRDAPAMRSIVESGLHAVQNEGRAEHRIARLVDTIKRVRLSEREVKAAA
jgi:hypothetical protein